jgi:hypothetical protein
VDPPAPRTYSTHGNRVVPALPQDTVRAGAVADAPSDAHTSVWARVAVAGTRPLLLLLDLAAVFVGVVGVEIVSANLGFDSPARKIFAFGLVLLALIWAAGL